MPRPINKLTDRQCQATTKPGMLGDGGGLYLNTKPTGSKSWSFVWRKGSKRHEMGLGSYPDIKLSRARSLAAQYRETVAEGRNPISERRQTDVPNFAECADRFLDIMADQWRNQKHRDQWRMTLTVYAAPIRDKAVSDITTEDILQILEPIWRQKNETASRLRGRIERVLDYATSRGWRDGANPALWRGHLKNLLPARSKLTRGHHAAMPYQDVPAFIDKLKTSQSISARALEFLILTAGRSGEIREATWDELDLNAGIWTIPPERMKAGKLHRVPLSLRALEIVQDLEQRRISDYVFPGQKPGRPMSNMAFTMLMRRLKADQYTVHGFRSAFRDWAGDETEFSRELAEQALAHQIGNEVERAYRRGDALEKRRPLMEGWAAYCAGETDNR